LLESIIEDSGRVRIENHHTMPIDRRVFVSELHVAGPKVRMISVLMEAKHQGPGRFDPVNVVVFMIDAGRILEANLQSCGLHIVGVSEGRRRIDIPDDVPRSASARAMAHILIPSLPRQSVVNVAKEGPLCIAVSAGKKDHFVRASD